MQLACINYNRLFVVENVHRVVSDWSLATNMLLSNPPLAAAATVKSEANCQPTEWIT